MKLNCYITTKVTKPNNNNLLKTSISHQLPHQQPLQTFLTLLQGVLIPGIVRRDATRSPSCPRKPSHPVFLFKLHHGQYRTKFGSVRVSQNAGMSPLPFPPSLPSSTISVSIRLSAHTQPWSRRRHDAKLCCHCRTVRTDRICIHVRSSYASQRPICRPCPPAPFSARSRKAQGRRGYGGP